SNGRQHGECAVLVRASWQMRAFEDRFLMLGIPYKVIGGPRFFERAEIRDAHAYFRLVRSIDDDLAFERIVNLPTRGIGKTTLQTVHAFARAGAISLTRAVARLIETDELRPQARKAFADLLATFERWRADAAQSGPAALARQVLEESGYIDMWRQKKDPDAPGRLDNLRELIVALEDFETLGRFLEHVSLVMENEERSDLDKVNLMTLHGAKGLEFETVFLPGWEEGIFPNQRSLDEGGLASLEEERRLSYVGLTRARKRAIISFAANRRVYGQWQSATPSRFVHELPPGHIDIVSEPGVYAGRDTAFVDVADTALAESMADNRRRRMVEGRGSRSWAAKSQQPSKTFQPGERVFHQKFGYGRIAAADGDKLEIDFEKAGAKRVMASFVEPA
ncbi:MAG: DNA helicase II, partial [Proteobacteria bacterium]|nr:DNA helicase II [Pseudomonadota bacterium]